MKFIKNPVVVEAYQVTKELLEDVLDGHRRLPDGLVETLCEARIYPDSHITKWEGEVTTIHGQKTTVVVNDWIIDEGDGVHFYPCKPDIFKETYKQA